MDLVGTRIIDASRERVYEALNDPEVLKACIPGCESLERVTDEEWRAVVAARIGPVAARFNGKVQLIDRNPPIGYTLKFQGQGAAAGFANGEARVSLGDNGNGQTELSYAAKAQVGGKLAQVGSRLVDGAAAKLTEDFFSSFTRRVGAPEGGGPGETVAPAGMSKPPGQGEREGNDSAHWVRYAAIIAIIVLLAFLYSRGGFR
ncbi:MAG TPA: carbon monoxide dehydrogenase subunit G [Casimicrobiaceae bacterium]|nr:carbon monoxide dehydrogenase subunit G [Casimicrobiaceae bacterium]